MVSQQFKTRPLALLFSLVLLATACIGPANPLILEVQSTPEAATEATAVDGAAVEAPVVQVNEVVPEDASAENAILAEEVDLDRVLMQTTFLVNRVVQNASGDTIGTVDDVIIDLQSGQILYIIFDRSALLGLGSNQQALPLAAFEWTNELHMILTINETVLDAAPQVESGWPSATTVGWDTTIAAFWNEQALLPAYSTEVEPIRLRPLLGIHAGGLGANLGVIEDLLVHLGEQRVAYLAIFSAEGFYTPDRVLIVPFTAASLEVETVDGGAIYGVTLLAVDADVLNSAPSMDRSLFLTVDLIDQTFTEELDAYWSQ